MQENIITEYIMMQDKMRHDHLWEIYELIESLIGDKTTKTMAYQMPTYKAKHNVVHFSATAKHVGIYPGPHAMLAFESEFGEYSHSTGTLRIKYNQPVPTELITKLVLYSYDLNK
ncbi:DUF1801 domain-containing protein [Mollicutes bacterium LVI A0039]|nr:DUF1801 domain-containing protein [Mollicutes bacterium LVI A0039]